MTHPIADLGGQAGRKSLAGGVPPRTHGVAELPSGPGHGCGVGVLDEAAGSTVPTEARGPSGGETGLDRNPHGGGLRWGGAASACKQQVHGQQEIGRPG